MRAAVVVAPLRGTKSLRCRGVEESLSDLGKAAVSVEALEGACGVLHYHYRCRTGNRGKKLINGALKMGWPMTGLTWSALAPPSHPSGIRGAAAL